MSGYAIVNLLGLDNAMADRTDAVEGRFARGPLGATDLGVSHWRFDPGARGVTHTHVHQEEAYVVVSGSGRIRLGDEVRDVGPWDVVRVAPEVIRGVEGGPDGLELLIVGGPTPLQRDGRPAPGPWPGDARSPDA